MEEFAVRPDPDDPRLTRRVAGIDQEGSAIETAVVTERPLTLFLNGREIVTMMTIGDHPDYLAVGYLLNQNMLRPGRPDHRHRVRRRDRDRRRAHRPRDRFRGQAEEEDADLGLRAGHGVRRSDGEVRRGAGSTADAVLRTSWLYALTRKINTAPSLYLAAGAIHGCVLCEEDRPLLYMEDVGRHNAVDKIAGYMHLNGISPAGKIFYTTGRLTSEMVIKTVQMGIPILVSRSGFTAWGVELARQAGLTLIGRAKGKRFVALAGDRAHRLRRRSRARSRTRRPARAQGEPAGRGRGVSDRRAAARRRPVAAHGRRRQGAAAARRTAAARPCHRAGAAAGRGAGAQCQWRSGAVCRLRPAGRRRQRRRISPGRSPACSPGSTGRPAHGPIATLVASVADRRAVSAARSRRAAARRRSTRRTADLACAASGGRTHPVIGLWPVRLRDDLRRALVEEGIRKVDLWTGALPARDGRFRRSSRSIRSSTPTGPRISPRPSGCSPARRRTG